MCRLCGAESSVTASGQAMKKSYLNPEAPNFHGGVFRNSPMQARAHHNSKNSPCLKVTSISATAALQYNSPHLSIRHRRVQSIPYADFVCSKSDMLDSGGFPRMESHSISRNKSSPLEVLRPPRLSPKLPNSLTTTNSLL